MTRPAPPKKPSAASQEGMTRSQSESFLNKGYLTVPPTTSNDNVSVSSKRSHNSGRLDVAVNMKPWDFLVSLLEDRGIEIRAIPYKEVRDDFFLKFEAAHFTAYDSEIARATRVGELAAVQARYRSRKPLLACNRFQETTIHDLSSWSCQVARLYRQQNRCLYSSRG